MRSVGRTSPRQRSESDTAMSLSCNKSPASGPACAPERVAAQAGNFILLPHFYFYAKPLPNDTTLYNNSQCLNIINSEVCKIIRMHSHHDISTCLDW